MTYLVVRLANGKKQKKETKKNKEEEDQCISISKSLEHRVNNVRARSFVSISNDYNRQVVVFEQLIMIFSFKVTMFFVRSRFLEFSPLLNKVIQHSQFMFNIRRRNIVGVHRQVHRLTFSSVDYSTRSFFNCHLLV
jgi:hypothetical protein